MAEEYSGEPRYRKVKKPTVFMFQPDEFEEIEPHDTAKLEEWEALMKTRVGLSVRVRDLRGLPTISKSGGRPVD